MKAILILVALLCSTMSHPGVPTSNAQARPQSRVVASEQVKNAKSGSAEGTAKFALLVGINAYRGEFQLDGCLNDIADVKRALIARLGFSTRNVRALTDRMATRTNILSSIQSHLVRNASQNPGCEILFYYSGHGSQVRDQNGDEEDGRDETLVPVDSDPVSGNRDITDDEIEELTRSIAKFTQNITFVLDCCHSGTITRGAGKAREIVRELEAPESQMRSATGRPPSAFSIPPSLAEGLVTISACRSSERAYESPRATRSNGALTFSFVRELTRLSESTTYREIMERVALEVSLDNPSQNPQVEGALYRSVLGGSAVVEDPYIRVERVDGSRITIAAGRIQGLKRGMIVGIYAPEAKQLRGDVFFLATGEVVEVGGVSSVVLLSRSATVPRNAKVVPVSSTFALEPVVVRLEMSSVGVASQQLQALIKRVVEIVSSDDLIEFRDETRSESSWDLAVRCDRGVEMSRDKTDELSVHVADRDGNAVYGLRVPLGTPQAAEHIVDVLRAYAQQRNLVSLTNDASSLTGRVQMRVIRLPDGPTDGASAVPGGSGGKLQTESDVEGDYRIPLGARFEVEIENGTSNPLYITLLVVSSDGSILQIAPPQGASVMLRPGARVRTATLRATEPVGVEVFKALASTRPADFSFLLRARVRSLIETRAATGAGNPLESLVRRALFGMRSGAPDTTLSNDAWTTSSLRIRVTPRDLQESSPDSPGTEATKP